MKRYTIALFAAAALVVGCGSDSNDVVANNSGQTGTSFRQIEQMARPAINEGLLFTNAFLNTYNAVSPAFVATALANPASAEGVAAAPIFTEATNVLTALRTAGGNVAPTPAQIVAAFLPDVMRCNSTLSIPVSVNNLEAGTSAYAFQLNAKGAPVSGRKLTDDVVDITYSVLVAPGITDSVPYYPPAGNTNPAIGHQNLNGQTIKFGAATFPFLAPAN